MLKLLKAFLNLNLFFILGNQTGLTLKGWETCTNLKSCSYYNKGGFLSQSVYIIKLCGGQTRKNDWTILVNYLQRDCQNIRIKLRLILVSILFNSVSRVMSINSSLNGSVFFYSTM